MELTTIRVELYGIPRRQAQTAACQLFFQTSPIQLRDVFEQLAKQHPGLTPLCINDGMLQPGFIANVNAEQFVADDRQTLCDGDTILLLSADAGG